jgi:hypothetical protein
MRDDLLTVHEQERQRLQGLAEQLETEVRELEAEAARKRELLSDCERRINVAVEFITQSRATVEKLPITDSSSSSAGKRSWQTLPPAKGTTVVCHCIFSMHWLSQLSVNRSRPQLCVGGLALCLCPVRHWSYQRMPVRADWRTIC